MCGDIAKGMVEILFSEHMTSVDREKTRSTTVLLCTRGLVGKWLSSYPLSSKLGTL